MFYLRVSFGLANMYLMSVPLPAAVHIWGLELMCGNGACGSTSSIWRLGWQRMSHWPRSKGGSHTPRAQRVQDLVSALCLNLRRQQQRRAQDGKRLEGSNSQRANDDKCRQTEMSTQPGSLV